MQKKQEENNHQYNLRRYYKKFCGRQLNIAMKKSGLKAAIFDWDSHVLISPCMNMQI